ncbi:hypothetical protein BJY04DRAFT_197248 [Aspergillus karnatakaensis]|uniref:uncharacterized protein n=1 Tax=Aspergillus karnatakaensis TaxID=1810916 RepID=UPI003CCD3994
MFRVQCVPFCVLALEVKLAKGHEERRANVHKSKGLAYAVAGPVLEWSPCSGRRVKSVAGPDEPALRYKDMRLWPVLGVALDCKVEGPDGTAFGRILGSMFWGREEARLESLCGYRWRVGIGVGFF